MKRCPVCKLDMDDPETPDACVLAPDGLFTIHRDDAFERHDVTGAIRHKATGEIVGQSAEYVGNWLTDPAGLAGVSRVT